MDLHSKQNHWKQVAAYKRQILDGLFDGDLVVVEKLSSADNGDVVVALLDDEATVKRFYRENGRIRLQPSNSEMEPIYVEPDRVAVIGKVILGLRRF